MVSFYWTYRIWIMRLFNPSICIIFKVELAIKQKFQYPDDIYIYFFIWDFSENMYTLVPHLSRGYVLKILVKSMNWQL